MATFFRLLLVAVAALSLTKISASAVEEPDDSVEDEEPGSAPPPFDLGEVVVVVLAPIQNSKSHSQSWMEDDDVPCKRARRQKEAWEEQMGKLTEKEPQVLSTREEWAPRGSWTILATLPVLKEMYFDLSTATHPKWFLFVTEDTQIDFQKLELVFRRFDPSEPLLLGHAIQDTKSTIIHHYAFYKGEEVLRFPILQAGIAVSSPLLNRMADLVRKVKINFNIDPAYEFAQVAKYLDGDLLEAVIKPCPQHKEGVLVTHVPEFCPKDTLQPGCATAFSMTIDDCDYPGIVKVEDVLFAVKTFSGNHKERLPYIHKTWGPDAGDSLMFFSDVEDPEFGTVYQGVPNSLKGHCDQTLAIIRRAHTDERLRKKDWIVIADDDSFFSVPRLLRYLSCYQPSESLVLGEAYGFFAHKSDGYSYVTGGGGIVLSRGAVNLFIEREIHCPSADHPDDMYIGHIAHYYNLDVVFTSLFHQDQPESYPPEIIQLQEPISFHRHKPTHPYEFYDPYLGSGRVRRRVCGHKKRSRSALLGMMEDEDLRRMMPPGFESKLEEYERLQERLDRYHGGSDSPQDIGWDDDDDDGDGNGLEEGECYYDDEEFEEHKSFYTAAGAGGGSRDQEGAEPVEGNGQFYDQGAESGDHSHQHGEL